MIHFRAASQRFCWYKLPGRPTLSASRNWGKSLESSLTGRDAAHLRTIATSRRASTAGRYGIRFRESNCRWTRSANDSGSSGGLLIAGSTTCRRFVPSSTLANTFLRASPSPRYAGCRKANVDAFTMSVACASPSRRQSAPPASADHAMATVSLCMIVKNEEANLAASLRPIVGLFDEIVVVDTGSADRTREIARDFARGSSISLGVMTSQRPATKACARRANGSSGWMPMIVWTNRM